MSKPAGRPSWAHCRKVIQQTRTDFAGTSNPTPKLIQTSPDAASLLMLGKLDGSEQHLLRMDTSSDFGLITSVFEAGARKLSKEEQLQRERQRDSSSSIASYVLDSLANTVYVPLGSDLVALDLTQPSPIPVPVASKNLSQDARLDVKACPTKPNILAFVRQGDLWAMSTVSGEETRLTFASTLGDDIKAGKPNYIVEEEFDRFTGYVWMSKMHNHDSAHADDDELCILYELSDERHCGRASILDVRSDHGIDTFPFPKPGQVNPISDIELVKLSHQAICAGGDSANHATPTRFRMRESLKHLFPWLEYIVRFGWIPNSTLIYAQLMNRRQTRLALVTVDTNGSLFVESRWDASSAPTAPVVDDLHSAEAGSASPSTLASLGVSVLLEETSTCWVNVYDGLCWLPHGTDGSIWADARRASQAPAGIVRFLWLTERSGHRHLELVESSTSGGLSHPSRWPLTSGPWEVDAGGAMDVCVQTGCIFFTANKETPLEQHLYVIRPKSTDTWLDFMAGQASGAALEWTEPFLLTKPGCWHDVWVDASTSIVIDAYSSSSEPWTVRACRIAGLHDGEPHLVHPMTAPLFSSRAVQNFKPPHKFSFVGTHGFEIHGQILLASDYDEDPETDEAGKRPTILYVYGGPHVQLVKNYYATPRFARFVAWARQGYNVIIVDGRGSANRGTDFEFPLHLSMGTFELDDQIEAIRWAASNRPEFKIDMARIGIHGWSYGGYVSLLAMARHNDFFKVAVAGAPVTEWEEYDTAYTERYMDLPEDLPQVYAQGSVTNLVEGFPDEPNRLLIIHGLMDENVHFRNTVKLIDKLVSLGKPHQLQVYPAERHGVRSRATYVYNETLMLHYFVSNL